jgi:hypothetical protein
MPRALRLLLARLLAEIAKATQALENGTTTVDAWRADMERRLTRYHRAALMAGLGATEMPPKGADYLKQYVGVQLDFLRNFAIEIAEGDTWKPAWNARAALYAGAVKGSYWRGAVKMLPVPATPGDGTSQCLGQCTCSLEVVWIDAENGDADVYWKLGTPETHHCQTCPIRATDWAPLRIRDGELQ